MLKNETINSESNAVEINKTQRYSIIQKFTEYNLVSAEEFV